MQGKQSIQFDIAPYIMDMASIVGKKEGEGPLGNLFDKIEEDYQNLYFIREIAYWLNPEHRHDELVNNSRYETINNLYKKLLNDILTIGVSV